VRSLPREAGGKQPVAHFRGEAYKHFQTATAETTFVLGEFPWQVRVGDQAVARDFVHPPRMLSCEETQGEKTWTQAEYFPGEKVWQAFSLPGKPPSPKGVYANQPSPHGDRVRRAWRTAGLVLALFSLGFCARISTGSDPVVSESRVYDPGAPRESQVALLGPFQLGGRTSNLEVEISTDLDNAWAWFDLALVNDETGRVLEFGREVSYYHGVDGGESWNEGSRNDDVRIPSVPPGRWMLRVEPQAERPVSYQVRLVRDVPAYLYWAVAFLLLLLPAVGASMGAAGFESKRWAESDYAPEDDDDDE
jgi:hypothetical protein